jgi:ankyrin repeat protein
MYTDNDSEEQNAFFEIVRSGDVGLIEHILNTINININSQNNRGETPLYQAVQINNLETVELLLIRGADPNMSDYYGETPLHLAIQNIREWEQDDHKIILLLLSRGADVNTHDNQGITPLVHAIQRNDIKTVVLLLSKGADVNKPDDYGVTPLQIAYTTGNTNIIAILEHWSALSAVPILNELNVSGIIDADFLTDLYNMMGGGKRRRKIKKTRNTSNKKRRKTLKRTK